MRVSEVRYRGWHHVYRLANKEVELLVTADVGPRILWFGLTDGENQFFEVSQDWGRTGDREFHLYGGHRLWIAPEGDRTMNPDNLPVEVEASDNSIRFATPVEQYCGQALQRAIEVNLTTTDTHVKITHRITNVGESPSRLAPWAISVMKPGGRAILPLPDRAAHDVQTLLPTSLLALWPYTDLSDARWKFGQNYVQLQHDSKTNRHLDAQKIGVLNPAAWVAYYRDGTIFLKRSHWSELSEYPDLGCNLEVFADSRLIELETLGPVQTLQPGATAAHAESWSLRTGVHPGEGDQWIEEVLLPALANA